MTNEERAIEWLYPGEELNPAQIRRDHGIAALARRFEKCETEARAAERELCAVFLEDHAKGYEDSNTHKEQWRKDRAYELREKAAGIRRMPAADAPRPVFRLDPGFGPMPGDSDYIDPKEK